MLHLATGSALGGIGLLTVNPRENDWVFDRRWLDVPRLAILEPTDPRPAGVAHEVSLLTIPGAAAAN